MKKINTRSKFLIILIAFIAVVLIVGILSPPQKNGIPIKEPSEAAQMYMYGR